MSENHTELDKNFKSSPRLSKYFVFLLTIIGVSLLVRLYYFPFDVPLSSDALYYFWYSSDIYQIKELPSDWTPGNNGWPIFVSFFFSLFDSKDILTFMQIQRLLAVLFSILISVPVYFLCKKFVSKKFALIGATLIAFDPRLMINSFLGVTDPLYLLLIATSLTVFLFSNKKLVYFSFVLASFAIIVRGEGIFFFVVLSILFFIRYRKEGYSIIFRYLAVIGIFTLIILPISIYRMDVSGTDSIFVRSVVSATDVLSDIEKSEDISDNIILNGSKIFMQYLIWILIPTFIIFIPLGIFLIFKNRNFDKNAIILSAGIMMIPAFYAYTIPALDTRYLYVLFPMFSVLAVLAIEKFSQKLNRPNIIIIGIIFAVVIASLVFFDQQKIDYEHEKEAFEIIKEISPMVKGVNSLGKELRYFSTVQTIEQWPALYSEMNFDTTIIPVTEFNNLENFINATKDGGLTHIIVDDSKTNPTFLRDIFLEENNYSYLNKIYDSKIDGFNYHVKVFEIDYQSFSNMN